MTAAQPPAFFWSPDTEPALIIGGDEHFIVFPAGHTNPWLAHRITDRDEIRGHSIAIARFEVDQMSAFSVGDEDIKNGDLAIHRGGFALRAKNERGAMSGNLMVPLGMSPAGTQQNEDRTAFRRWRAIAVDGDTSITVIEVDNSAIVSQFGQAGSE